jgi:hypothetical protein
VDHFDVVPPALAEKIVATSKRPVHDEAED